jgi:NDP-sugar pyrophosphorylase family protein
MQGLILAGGEGTRMGRLTVYLPKPLLYLPGGTLLDHQLALLSRAGVGHTFVVTRHREEEMIQALAGLTGVTRLPQQAPYTLLGALASAEGHVSEPFLVLHGDNYFSQGLAYLLDASRCAADDRGAKGVFLVEDGEGRRGEAERLASTGCYMLSPGLLDLVRKVSDGDELRSLTGALLASGVPVEGVPLRGWRANVNTSSDLLDVSRRILESWSGSFEPARADEGYNRRQRGSQMEFPLWVSPEAETVRSRLGPFVVIGPDAMVRDCVLRETIVFPGAQIRGLTLRRAVVLRGPDAPLVLASQDESDRCKEGHGEEEPS